MTTVGFFTRHPVVSNRKVFSILVPNPTLTFWVRFKENVKCKKKHTRTKKLRKIHSNRMFSSKLANQNRIFSIKIENKIKRWKFKTNVHLFAAAREDDFNEFFYFQFFYIWFYYTITFINSTMSYENIYFPFTFPAI